MPQNNSVLPTMYTAPMATGIAPSMMYGMEGVPLPMGSDPRFALAGQFLLAPRVRQMMASGGYAPMGLGHDQNIYDTFKKQAYTQAQAQVVQAAAMHDRENMFKTFRGMSAMAGIGFGAEQRRAANSMADMATIASPMLAAMNPDLLDQMSGTRGSAAVMAKRMMDAGRYRLDPVSGRLGTSTESMNRLVEQVYGDLFLRGDPKDMHGLSAGQAGSLYKELVDRGAVYGDSRQVPQRAYGIVREMGRRNPDELAAAAKRQGVNVPGDMTKISAADLDKLTLDDSVASRLRSFDADKIKRSLKTYAGAVTAMRDIFGDMGHPNAPMSELMGGLEALTMGSMAQMDPARAGMIARQTHNLAKQSGVTMDAAMILQQHAGARAQQLGLEPIFAVQATQGALAFGGAYRSQGHAAHTAFGAFNADQMTQLDANLRLQAAGSNMANQLGAAMRIRESVSGFKEGSDAQRFTTAVMSGVNEFVDSKGKVRSLNMSQGEFTRMMTEAGVDEGTVRDILDQRDTNREQVDRYGISNIVRKEQATGEIRPQIALRMGETLNQRLRGTGKLSDEAVTASIDKASPAAARRIMGMSTEKFARTGEREAEIGRILEEELSGTEAGKMLASMDPDERKQFLRVTATQFYGNVDRFVKNSGYRGMVSFQNVHRSMNADVMREADRQQIQARYTSELQEAMSPLGRGTSLQRAIDAMQEVREGDTDSMQKVMVKAFGGVDTREINLALQKPLADLARKKEQIEQLTARVARTPDSEEKTRLVGELDGLMREVKAQSNDLAKTAERFGIYKDGGLTTQDTERALKSTSDVARTIMDLSGVRGAFGKEVSDEERAAVVRDYNAGSRSREEAAVVIMERRRHDPAFQASKEEAEKLAAASGGKVSVDQAMASITARKQASIANISDADLAVEMAKGGIDTNIAGGSDVASALALHRRSRMPLRGSAERVKKLMAETPGMTEVQAQYFADTEARALRLGLATKNDKGEIIAGKEVEMYHKGDKDKGLPPTSDIYGAIEAAITNREMHRYVVSDDQRKAFYDAAGLKDRLDLNTPEGKKAVDEMILKRRAGEERDRFRGFRQSDDGARFREDVDMRSQDVENVMTKLITSPQMMKRFGMWSIKMHDDLKAGQQRLRDLAMLHTGGDMSRLMMGDFDIDAGTVEGAQKAAKVREEVRQVVTQQTRLIHGAHKTHTQGVSTFEALQDQGDNKVLDPVRDLVKRHTMIAMGLSPDMTVDELRAKQPEKLAEFDRVSRIESEKLNLDALHPDHQKGIMESKARLNRLGSHFQLGSVGEALILSKDPNIKDVRELARRHALIAMGLPDTLSFDEMKAQHPEKFQKFLDTFHVEANKLNLPGLHVTHQKAVLDAREKVGNVREALGLLGVRQMPGETIDDTLARMDKEIADPSIYPKRRDMYKEAKEKLERTTKAVAASRRIRPEDTDALSKHTELMDRVEAFAATHDTSAKEMADMLGGKAVTAPLKLSDPEKAQIAEANKKINELAGNRSKIETERAQAVAELAAADTPTKRAAASKKIAEIDSRLDANAAEVGKTRQGLGSLARREGVSVEELRTGERTAKKLTAFSSDEEMAVGRARSQIEESDKELLEAENDVRGAEYALGRETLTADERRDWEVKQAGAMKRVAEARQKKRDALKPLEGIAKSRGVTSEELVRTEKGRLTKAQLEVMKEELTALGKSTPEVQAILASRGITMEELRDVEGLVTQQGERRQREHAARESTPPIGLLSELQQVFGGKAIDASNIDEYRAAAGRVGGSEQIRMLQSVIGTQESITAQANDAIGVLEARAKKFEGKPEAAEAKALLDRMKQPGQKTAGRDVMVQHYQDAMSEADPAKRKAALEKFSTTFGMTDVGMQRFERAYELQRRYGTLGYRGDASGIKLGEMIDQMKVGGFDPKTPTGPGGAPSSMHVTGVLEIKGTRGYVDAVTGGSATNVGPGG